MKYIIDLTAVFILLLFVSLSAQTQEEIIINNNLKIIPITENTYRHVSNLNFNGYIVPCNGLLFIDNNECLVVDTPPDDSLTINLIDWIKKNKKVKIIGIVATHWHNDCAGGLQAFHSENVPSYSLKFTRDTLMIQNLPAPENIFTDSMKIKVGGKFAELYYPGPGHAKDNIVVWLEDEKILFGGCLVKEFKSKSIGYIGDAELNLWDKSLEKVKNKFNDAKTIIPGHGDTGNLELIDKSIKIVLNYKNKK